MARGAAINNEALVLAAGSGRRFGGSKLTSPWNGGLLIDAALAAAFAAPVRTVTVITGADPKVGPAAKAFAARTGQSARLRLVHAADHLDKGARRCPRRTRDGSAGSARVRLRGRG